MPQIWDVIHSNTSSTDTLPQSDDPQGGGGDLNGISNNEIWPSTWGQSANCPQGVPMDPNLNASQLGQKQVGQSHEGDSSTHSGRARGVRVRGRTPAAAARRGGAGPGAWCGCDPD